MNEEQKIEKIENIVSKSSAPRRKIKCFMFIVILLVSCMALLSLLMAFLWYGGHAQTSICKVVEKDSKISSELDCASKNVDTKTEGTGDYQYNVLDDNGSDVAVSDQEEVVTNVVEKSTQAVVGIGIKGNSYIQDQIIGSGFIITANGLIVTNQHVVSNPTDENYYISLPSSTEKISVEKIYRDEVNDIAVIKINKDKLPIIPLGDSDKIKVGNTVIAIGNPLGDLSSTVTVGTVSGLNRDVEVGIDYAFSTRTFSDVIQTDAAINPGNSGGPLLNTKGEVIGINFATISGAEGLSFALPINRIKTRIDELNKFGDFRIPYLGVEYRRRVVFYNNEALIGDVINKVAAGSPAEKAGLQVGDIIIQFKGKTMDENALLDLIQKSTIGDEVEIVVLRNGENQTVKVKIEARGN